MSLSYLGTVCRNHPHLQLEVSLIQWNLCFYQVHHSNHGSQNILQFVSALGTQRQNLPGSHHNLSIIFFHGDPRPKKIPHTSIYQVVRSKKLNKYLCPVGLCIISQTLKSYWTLPSSTADFNGFHRGLPFYLKITEDPSSQICNIKKNVVKL